MKVIMRMAISLLLASVFVLSMASQAWAFCGFYVAGVDAKLFNQASQVIIAHQGDRTILTMANDFQGNVKDFALVVPVPVAIKKEQVNVGKKEIIQKLDAFTQPRLVEYNDPDPCQPISRLESDRWRLNESALQLAKPAGAAAPNSLGVTIEDQFKVNEYEILILSAKESTGLETWLRQNGYKIPTGASAVLQPYIRQQMKFFVAKVDLKELEKSGSSFLRPLQIAYQSPKFMLPIRLGMLNAKGEQDLVAYILSPKGQVEVVNYRTAKIPTGSEIPEYVKNDFGNFYKSTFQRSYEKENKKVAFLEYAWDVSNCDPCSTTPPSAEELKQAGVFWSEENNSTFITRLHVRYTRDRFAEDLVFQETTNRDNFQGRYVMNHPFRGEMKCSAASAYQQRVAARQEREAQNLASLTGWKIGDIRKRVRPVVSKVMNDDSPFWRKIWPTP